MWKDYDLDNPATWTVMEAPTVDRAWEETLTRIGGLNPFGKPMLVWRWGATYVDPMREDGSLKYLLAKKEATLVGFEFTDPITNMQMTVAKLEDIPPHILIPVPKYEAVQLGERRIIIERWRSAEFLAQTGRFHKNFLRDPGKTYEWFFCKACDAQLLVGEDGPKPCAQCGSKRSYQREQRMEGEGKLLRDFPHEGTYDFFHRIETPDEQAAPPDGRALQVIEAAWYAAHHLTDQQHEAIIDAMLEQQTRINPEAANPSNPFIAPRV
nr:hypothetical protein [uncultured bacterium]